MIELCFDIEPDLTKELLLSKHSQEKYMEHYLGVHVGKGLFKSPLRHDSNPTCSFLKNGSGELIMKDFGSDFYGNFIAVVMTKFSVSYYKALRIIANDFGIIKTNSLKVNPPKIEYSNTELEETKTCNIQIEAKEFSEKELKWWASFGITTKTLKKYRVFSCKNVFLNGNFFTNSTEKIPIYGYYGGKKDQMEFWRIYMPTKTKYRFLSNWSKFMIQGAHILEKDGGDFLVITKSMKDVMLLYELGVTAIAPNTETTFLSNNQLKNLKNKFKHIVLFYDNDLAGVSSMNRIRKDNNIKCVWLPRGKAKDISDFYKKHGKEETLKIIEYAKKRIKGT